MSVRWGSDPATIGPHAGAYNAIREAHEALRVQASEASHAHGDLLGVAERIRQLSAERHQIDELAELCGVLPSLVIRERVSQATRR